MPGIVTTTTTTTTTTTSITKSPVDKLEGENIFCIGDKDDNDVVTVVSPRHPPPSSRTLADNDKDKTTSSKIEKETHRSRNLHKDAPGAYTMIHSTVSKPLPSSLSLVKSPLAPPPHSSGLDRQRAGLVQPNPGAYAITHPDFQENNNNNNNNSTTTLESESESVIGSATTFVSSSILTATTTTADDSQILRDRYDTNSHSIQNKEDENEGGGEAFLIEAELVKSSVFALEIEPIDEVAEKKRKRNIIISTVVGFLVVVITCVCAVLLERKEMTAEEIFYKKHGYKCFTSTQKLNYAQISDFIDTNYTKTKDTYVICPDTTINIGVRTGGGVYEDGDYPLRVLTSNTTIQCDATMDDGNYNDNDNDKPCVLHGGPAQIMQSENGAVVEDWIGFFSKERKYIGRKDVDVKTFYRMLLPLQNLEYVTIRGLTFSGTILKGVKRYGFSIILNQTGSILFDECTWKDMIAPTGVVLVALTSRDYPTTNNTNTKLSTQLTIRNSQFINIEYNHHLIGVYNQMLVLQNTTFTNITIEDFSPPCTDNRWNVESEMTSDKNECLYFMACVGDAICNIKDSCRIDNDNSNYEFLYDNDDWLYESKTTTVQIDDKSKECGFY